MSNKAELLRNAEKKIREAENAKPSFIMIIFWMVLFFPVGIILALLRMYVSYKVSQAYKQLAPYKGWGK